METNTLLQYGPYALPRAEKRRLFAGVLTGLTQFHRENCPEYGRLLRALGCVPASPPRCPELLQVRERRHREVQELVGLPQQEAAELRFQRRILS